ncbi:putative CRISPR-associated helicase [Kitasatospora setae KM-6054]|uniref:Putative CRISPR-associated helicase n=1 Tax=Kitasatospora setae (strain ATCC 33774 / DSM 43861 / JCM 3304 / KCC A-0304 / NBRC 14216 / KM-6054) TaxID=452652 RepID=E4N5B3_KITSK|nr:CRISPR-associated helicase/endonuclease Cas3 [Kitasatospora setae]BAJ26394.1 putative CRISPR-associated helicase [Kitasatospora setae KM-6054]
MSRWGLSGEAAGWLGALWGKSAGKAGGTANLLISHMLDTAAVAEVMWEEYLPPVTRRRLDVIAGGRGRGRLLFVWLCGVHDLGKATPAFQFMDAAGAAAVRAAGLRWNEYTLAAGKKWRHDRAGGRLLRRLLAGAGWSEEQTAWVWPLVAGHHGTIPTVGDLAPPKKNEEFQGRGAAWQEAQAALLEVFSREVGFGGECLLAEVQPCEVPPRAVQLQLSGFVVMADWIASNEQHFHGVADLAQVSMEGARRRSRAAWSALQLRGGWGQLEFSGPEFFQDRFGDGPRSSQQMVLDAVYRMGGPGLVIIEAPMGEGKTKAALAAAEVLAARSGADGVFLGMPTQATADPMFTQVRSWLGKIDERLAGQVALLHGKRIFNKEWRALLDGADGFGAQDCYGSVGEDEYGMTWSFGEDESEPQRRGPSEWFLGRRRGLLSPFAVGTVDQLLQAATRTKHVMLRMAGLVGKVVILDEVHAADVYMSQFLLEGLRWLGQAGVPVLLLSATLPPGQRRDLVAAYLAGAQSAETLPEIELPQPGGYPNVTTAWVGEDGPQLLVDSTDPWREDLKVKVRVLDEPVVDQRSEDPSGPTAEAVAEFLQDQLVDGGCALVIRNTVDRAQRTFEALCAKFGDQEVHLLHGRLHAGHRADRTAAVLEALGRRDDGRPRPQRMVVVATQLAEQSFDVDADLLVTDLAPIDLLLQRIGRLHRHDGNPRPSKLTHPTVVVTGLRRAGGGVPWLLRASEGIYGRYPLLRTAAEVIAADGGGWSIPGQVPQLVARVYGTDRIVPSEWAEEESTARKLWNENRSKRREAAAPYLLVRAGEHGQPTLEGLHYGGQGVLRDGQMEALVRDGDPSVEVLLVRRAGEGYRAMTGRALGPNGETAAELLDDVLTGTVRLPAKLTAAVEQHALGPLPGWRDHPWLRYGRALELDERDEARLGGCRLRYDDRLGLVVTGRP